MLETIAMIEVRPMPEDSPQLKSREVVGALLLILVVLGAVWATTRQSSLTIFDQPFYLGIAYDIRHSGQYTDGFLFADEGAGGAAQERPPGMRFAPLYPALLAAFAAVDSGFADAMDCVVESRAGDGSCSNHAASVRWFQFAMLAGIFLAIWWMSFRVGKSRRIAWLALILALINARFLLGYARLTMTEITTLACFTAGTAFCIAAIDGKNKHALLAASGAMLGLAALTRPAFLYPVLIGSVVGIVWALILPNRRKALTWAAAFALGGALVVGPWIARNAVVLHRPALTAGYDSHTLVQRVSFDSMTSREYAMSYICWLPDFGSHLGNSLFGADSCVKFMWDERPDTFYMIGLTTLMQETLKAAGGWDHHLSYLLREKILKHPLKHILVSIPFALRGAWIGHYWGLIGAPICVVLTVRAWRRRRIDFLILSLPAWFLLAFHSAVAVNQTRYNLVLIAPFALSGAIAVDSLIAAFRRHKAMRPSPAA